MHLLGVQKEQGRGPTVIWAIETGSSLYFYCSLGQYDCLLDEVFRGASV